MTTQMSSWEDYQRCYAESVANPEAFWRREAEGFSWEKPFDKTVEWDFD